LVTPRYSAGISLAYLQDILDCSVRDTASELRQETSERVVEKGLAVQFLE